MSTNRGRGGNNTRGSRGGRGRGGRAAAGSTKRGREEEEKDEYFSSAPLYYLSLTECQEAEAAATAALSACDHIESSLHDPTVLHQYLDIIRTSSRHPSLVATLTALLSMYADPDINEEICGHGSATVLTSVAHFDSSSPSSRGGLGATGAKKKHTPPPAGQFVPPYYANVGNEPPFYRKYVSLLGLRNLLLQGGIIFEELYQNLFRGSQHAYGSGQGLNRMHYYTGNLVDLDTMVLDCSGESRDKLGAINAQLAADNKRTFPSLSTFFGSPEACQMARGAASIVLESFVDLLGLRGNANVIRGRQLDLSDSSVYSSTSSGPVSSQVSTTAAAATAATATTTTSYSSAPIYIASSNADRGTRPLWGYINSGIIRSYHANAPNVPDVIGSVLRAPLKLAAVVANVLRECYAATDSSFFSGGDSRSSSKRGKMTSSPSFSSFLKTEMGELFLHAINDRCFNEKWRAIESYTDHYWARVNRNIDTVLGQLEERYQQELSCIDLDEQERYVEALYQVVQEKQLLQEQSAVVGFDPVTQQRRAITKDDVASYVARNS